MSKLKPYGVISGFALFVMVAHFFSVVYIPAHYTKNEASYANTNTDELFQVVSFTGEDLSHLFGIEYKDLLAEQNQKEGVIESGASQILLNDIAVTIRAISQRDNDAIVYVLYQQDGKNSRDKLSIGNELFGYKLVRVTHNELTFERENEMLNFKIFKAKKTNEGTLK